MRPWGVETQIRPVVPPKTFTITRTEQSNMSSGWTYSDDAAWLTAGSTAFDEFFWYSAVKLAANWTESSEVIQSSPWTLDITQLWTLTSGDNVMIKFPVRWIKMTNNSNTITLSITEWLGRESEWYQYYAFQNTWDVNANANTKVATKPLYLWTYLSYKNSNVLKSWSGKTPQGWNTMGNELSYAAANGTWWTIMWFYQRCLINAYYIMKYWNPNWQTAVWRWFVNWNSSISTWWTNNYTSATWWESTWYYQCKLFWLEDWRWNQYQWIWWLFTDNSKNVYTALHNFTANLNTWETQYKNVWTVYSNFDYQCIGNMIWTNKWMFIPTSWQYSSNYSTYYCDYWYVGKSNLALAWGMFGNGYGAWPFCISIANTSTSVYYYAGSRLMYL